MKNKKQSHESTFKSILKIKDGRNQLVNWLIVEVVKSLRSFGFKTSEVLLSSSYLLQFVIIVISPLKENSRHRTVLLW